MLEIQFTRGVPPVESFPTHQLAECAQAVLEAEGNVVLQYGPARGYLALREWIAHEAGAKPDQVILGQGSLQLQDVCARVFLDQGDVVYVEAPSYDRALTIFRRSGAKVVGFPIEEDGPNLDQVQSRLEHGERPKLFYVIPDFQNPSGCVLSEEKRRRIAALAEAYGFWVVEDVPYRKLRYRGEDLPTLLDIAPDRVLQMSSFSKLISPGLRVGYIIVPDHLSAKVAKMAEETYVTASYLNQAMVYEFIRRGWLEPQIDRLKKLYAPRLEIMLAGLCEEMVDLATWHEPEGGFFVGVTLNRELTAQTLLERAVEAGLQLTDGRGFFPSGNGDRFVRLPFCALSSDQIKMGITKLADVVRSMH